MCDLWLDVRAVEGQHAFIRLVSVRELLLQVVVPRWANQPLATRSNTPEFLNRNIFRRAANTGPRKQAGILLLDMRNHSDSQDSN